MILRSVIPIALVICCSSCQNSYRDDSSVQNDSVLLESVETSSSKSDEEKLIFEKRDSFKGNYLFQHYWAGMSEEEFDVISDSSNHDWSGVEVMLKSQKIELKVDANYFDGHLYEIVLYKSYQCGFGESTKRDFISLLDKYGKPKFDGKNGYFWIEDSRKISMEFSGFLRLTPPGMKKVPDLFGGNTNTKADPCFGQKDRYHRVSIRYTDLPLLEEKRKAEKEKESLRLQREKQHNENIL